MGKVDMLFPQQGILHDVAAEAVRLGVESIEVEYKDGYEEVFALRGGMAVGIARFPSSGRGAGVLRQELYALAKKKQRVVIGDAAYELRARKYESFGEDVLRVALLRI